VSLEVKGNVVAVSREVVYLPEVPLTELPTENRHYEGDEIK
jgi:hypothetical protein